MLICMRPASIRRRFGPMNPEHLKRQLSKAIGQLSGVPETDIYAWIEVPPDPAMGDLALPCFRLSKHMRQAPQKIAGFLHERLTERFDQIVRMEAVNGYFNVFYDRVWFADSVIREALEADGRPGYNPTAGAGKTALIEFSSPNIAKEFHIGHAFTTLLGQAIANLYEYRGYSVVRMNHLGDYGTQFGNLIVAWKRWGDEAALAADPIAELQRVYVRFHRESEADPELEAEGRSAFLKLERGDPEAVQLWQTFRQQSLDFFNLTYDRLGIHFDNTNGESFYSDKIPGLMNWLRSRDLLTMSEGAVVVDLEEYKLPPCLLIKTDGTTIYASRDLAAILWRDETYNFDLNVYVVGLPQSHHFKQVFSVMKKAGFEKADRLIHVGFGTVLFGDQTFSTRQGNTIPLNRLLDESVAKTRAIIEKNNPGMSAEQISETAEKIGISAVVYTFLQNGREKDIHFSWDQVLDFEGDSAPYLLYTLARCHSIRAKADTGHAGETASFDKQYAQYLTDNEAVAVLKLVDSFGLAIDAAVHAFEPSIMIRHTMTLARAFNKFYQNHSFLFADSEAESKARLFLLDAVIATLSAGIRLAGMQVVERM